MARNKFDRFFNKDKMSINEAMHMYYSLIDKVKPSEREMLSEAYYSAWDVINKKSSQMPNRMA